MNVIVSVPHAFCEPGPRNCDTMAKPFAKLIRDALLQKGIESELYIANTLRSTIDTNRIAGRNSAFRLFLDKRVENLSCDDIILDIHSAPFDTLKRNFEIYLLDIADLHEDDDFNDMLWKYLSSRGIVTYKMHGSMENDIVVSAITRFCISNVSLIEINESLTMERVREIALVIADYISSTVR